MRLSIVIPCYNMEVYLPQCLDSLLDQGLDTSEFEILVVNDGSGDNTLAIAREYASQYSNIKVIDKQNAGVGAARNTGLDLAQGQYVYFLDPDDYLAQEVLTELLTLAEENDLDILTFQSTPVKPNEYIRESRSIEEPRLSETTDGITYIAHKKFPNEIWWYLIRRDFLTANKLRFIEGRWMEDAILTAQLFCKAERMAHINMDAHRYRILPTSAMRNKTPAHYNKVIFDNANAAHVFDSLLKTIPENHVFGNACYNRLKTRQQSFVFFLLVRLMKSDIEVNKISGMLEGFESIDAYPLNKFLGKDYHGFSYSFMVFIFNNKILISPFVRFFRVIYRIIH